MTEKTIYRRQFFRVDTFLPLKAGVVPPEARDHLQARIGNQADMKPVIVNISGGGISFKAKKKYDLGDVLEIDLTLPLPASITICLYGEVLKVEKTAKNHYQTFIKFINISENIRERIITFVFQWEREMLMHVQTNYDVRYTAIPIYKLVEGTVLPFEVFTKDGEGMKYLFDVGLPYDGLAQEFFEEQQTTTIYIKDDDLPLFDDYLQKFRVKPKLFDKESLLSFKEYSFNKRLYHPIDREVMSLRSEINFSLFVMKDFLFSPHIETYPEKPVTIDEEILSASGDFLIKKTDIQLYWAYLESRSLSLKNSSDAGSRALVLKEKANIVMDQLLADPESTGKMKEAMAIIPELAACIFEHMDSIYKLVSLDYGDFYSYIHSVNVASMSIAAGIALNMKKDAVEKLGIGGLLHDIGHSVINDEIINKYGKLNKYEYEVYKTHVIESIKILAGHEGIPEESLTAVVHHHEKLNGKGYPSGLSGKHISLFGRITAIADSYDVLIPNRPYKERQTPFQALTMLIKEAHEYDPEILKVFVRIFSKVK